jgi:hypothetical protein
MAGSRMAAMLAARRRASPQASSATPVRIPKGFSNLRAPPPRRDGLGRVGPPSGRRPYRPVYRGRRDPLARSSGHVVIGQLLAGPVPEAAVALVVAAGGALAGGQVTLYGLTRTRRDDTMQTPTTGKAEGPGLSERTPRACQGAPAESYAAKEEAAYAIRVQASSGERPLPCPDPQVAYREGEPKEEAELQPSWSQPAEAAS